MILKSRVKNRSIKRKSIIKHKKKIRSSKKGSKRKTNKRKTNKRKKYKLQPQKKNYDCALACISMFSRIPYNLLKNKYFKDHNFNKEGVIQDTEKKILGLEGFKVKYVKKIPIGKPAIVSVDSLNYPDTYHDIFWDGYNIYDPNIGNKRKNSKLKIYKTLKNVDIVQILA